MFPPKPNFTDKDLPDLSGKVYLASGSNTGVRKHLAAMLYSKNAKVYMAAWSESKASQAIQATQDIKARAPQLKGALVFLHLDLADLASIKESAQRLASLESKLNVVFNNAGVQAMDGAAPGPARTKQGHEMNLGVNVLGTFLLTRLLNPLLVATAACEPPGSVRVVWVSSVGAETNAGRSR